MRECSDCKEEKAEKRERAEKRAAEEEQAEYDAQINTGDEPMEGLRITNAHSGKALTMHYGYSVTQEDVYGKGQEETVKIDVATNDGQKEKVDKFKAESKQEYQLWNVKMTEAEYNEESGLDEKYYEIYNKGKLGELYLCAGQSWPHNILKPWWSNVFTVEKNDGRVAARNRQWILKKVNLIGDKIEWDGDNEGKIEGLPDVHSHYIIQNRQSKYVLDINKGSMHRGMKLLAYKKIKVGKYSSDGNCRNQVFQFKHMR